MATPTRIARASSPRSEASSFHTDTADSVLPQSKPRHHALNTPPQTSLPHSPEESGNPRKWRKVSRACDFCKVKKLRCSGTLPCSICTRKNQECIYAAQYRRGRPPTPPSASVAPSTPAPRREARDDEDTNRTPRVSVPCENPNAAPRPRTERDSTEPIATETLPSRGSPELDTAEIGGQFFDPTSNLTFLHRAWKRLSLQKGAELPGVLNGSESMQPLMSAGDRPFSDRFDQPLILPPRARARELLDFYFDKCVVTYRCLHNQLCIQWLNSVLSNAENNFAFQHEIGHAKAALVLEILAIAALRQEKIAGNWSIDEGGYSLLQSDQLFCAATALTNDEKGLPQLESVQARVLQILYLLQTARMNQAWYVFGSVVPIVSALGLHRKSSRNRNNTRTDYIVSQCRKRTFWVVYTIDKYLAVVLGRPRLYHDDDIDQEYPDRVNDEDMTPQGPSLSEPSMDCHVDSLIFHAKIAGIVDNVSKEVYSLRSLPKKDRLAAAQRLVKTIKEWRDELPPHLGTVRPRSLIPSFRRQAMALKLAYCHAIIHANRPFLLASPSESNMQDLDSSVNECINAAKMALETIDGIVTDGSLFHALWWTPYVTFCALAVVYVWEIQQKKNDKLASDDPQLFELAERCQGYLAQSTVGDSPSHRYSVILDELRLEARHGRVGVMPMIPEAMDPLEGANGIPMELGTMFPEQGDMSYEGIPSLSTEWQATDWLDLDSSAFRPFPDYAGSPILWTTDSI